MTPTADLAEVAGLAVTILTANASGGFAPGTTYTLAAPLLAVATGNFTGHTNGTLDLAVLANDGTVTVLPGTGLGTFNAAAKVVTGLVGGAIAGSKGSMVAADFNADGKADLAVATTGDGKLQVLLGAGTSGFATPVEYAPASGAPSSVVAADFTGDGKPDLASLGGGTITMLVGGGTGGFTLAGTTDPYQGVALRTLTAGDFYGTGQVGVAATVYDAGGAGGFAILPGSPSGSWGNAVLYHGNPGDPRTTNSQAAAAADLNGDGRPDLVLAYGALSVVPSDPDSNQVEPAVPVAAAGTAVVVTAAAPFTGRSRAPSYAAPMGDTSTLTHNPGGTWTRTYPDGTVLQFDASGREVSQADRNGNTTTYAYVAAGLPGAGALKTVTDPVGLVTTLAYDASGHIGTITDPAGRVTALTVDSGGNLTRVVDPAGSVTQYGYATPANHRITTEVSPNSQTATAHYDGFGRLTSETLFDGTSTTTVGAAQERGLLAPGGSGPLPLPGGFQGTVTDPNGHATTLTFDVMSHPTASADALGHATTYVRNMQGWATSVTDPDGRTTTYAYDTRGDVTGVTRPDSSSMTIAYDPTYNVPTQITDYRGLVTTFTLDPHGNVTRRTDPDLLHEDFTYNTAGQVLTDTDRNGHVTTYHYDARGRPDTVTFPGTGSPSVGFTYDAAGDVLTVTDELGHLTTFTYDQAGRLLTAQDPVQATPGLKTTYAYDPDGNLTSVTDALGHLTSYTYDARDRLATRVDPANQGTGRQTTYGYDGMNLTSVTDPLGHATTYSHDADNRPTGVTDALGHAISSAYDPAGQLTGITDANGNATTYTYDSLGRLQTRTLPGTAPDAWGQQVAVQYTYGYDADGNLTSVTDALRHSTSLGYDVLNRRTSSSVSPDGYTQLTTAYAYDPVGNLTSVTDPLNHATTYAYDARDRRTGQTAPAGGGTTTYAYDAHSRLTSLTDPVGNLTSYGYDNADRVTTVTDPRAKLTTTAYDLVGNATQVTDRDGRVRQFGYDADNRPTIESWIPAGGGTPLRTITTAYDAAGRVTSVADPASQYAYGYDNANRLTSVDDLGTPGLPRVVLSYGYDAAGNRTGLSDSLGGQYAYTYDVRNQLTGLSQTGTTGSGVAAELVQLAHDAAGRMTGLNRYSDLAGTLAVLATAYGYDGADRLTSLTHQVPGGAVVAQYGYTLDDTGRLTSETRSWTTTGGTASDTLAYGYTDDNQLTSVSHTNSSFANESFGYDANGNRNTTGYSTTTGNRLAGDGTYTYAYDDEGNLTSKTAVATGVVTTYAWDYRNRLTQVQQTSGGVTTTVAQYTYDVLNRPIQVVEGGATRQTLYDGQTPLLDFDGAGAVTARYLSVPGAIDELLARQTSAGVAWYLAARLGTVRDLVDNTGAVIDHVDYGAFGNPTGETSPAVGDRIKFAGMELDAATGEYYDRARYYDAAMGRFISQDPSGFAARDANLYRYVTNGSTLYVDPSGLGIKLPDIPLHDGKVGLTNQDLEDLVNIPKNRWKGDCDKALDTLEKLADSLKQRFSELNPSTGSYTGHLYRYLLEYWVYLQLYPKITSSCGDQGPNRKIPKPHPLPPGTPPMLKPIQTPTSTNLPAVPPSPPGLTNRPTNSLPGIWSNPNNDWWQDIGLGVGVAVTVVGGWVFFGPAAAGGAAVEAAEATEAAELVGAGSTLLP